MSAAEPFKIQPENDLVALESILKRKGTDGVLAVRDLTGADSVKITIINRATGTVVVDEAAATVVTASEGLVRYTFAKSSIGTAGIYSYRWTEYRGTATASYPVESFDGLIHINGPNQTAQEAYRAAVEAG